MERDEDANSDVDREAGTATSIYSCTSTIKYNQEPWCIFKEKVARLSINLFPSASPSNVEIERMHGGAENRIVGITIKPATTKTSPLTWLRKAIHLALSRELRKEEKYILRIPRFRSNEIVSDIAILRFLSSRVKFGVPEVLSFDSDENNALGAAYSLQRRLSGQCLQPIWDDLNIEQLKSVACQVVSILKELHDVTYSSCAQVASENCDLQSSKSSAKFFFTTLRVPQHSSDEDNFGIPFSKPSIPQTPLEFILDQVNRHKHYQGHLWGTEEAGDLPPEVHWDQFASIATYLYTQGFLPDDSPFILTHHDLAHRNIMLEIESDKSVKITGVLDWDSSLFAPFYMAYRAPFWLWMNNEDGEKDEGLAIREPSEDYKRQLKKIFDDEAGEKWKEIAYTPEYTFLRRMFYPLRDGCHSSWVLEECQKIVEDWKEYMATKDPTYEFPAIEDDDSDSDTESEPDYGTKWGSNVYEPEAYADQRSFPTCVRDHRTHMWIVQQWFRFQEGMEAAGLLEDSESDDEE